MAVTVSSSSLPGLSSRLSSFSVNSPESGLNQADGTKGNDGTTDPKFLITSPYTETAHLLDLGTLDLQDQLLARALTIFDAQRSDYATAAYVDTFNFPEIVAKLQQLCASLGHVWQEQSFYIVVFRSQIPQTTDYSHLGELDKEAHHEAMRSGGFLKYWFGSPDANGRNLATCIWRKNEDAKRGSVGAAHRRAAGATRFLYKEWRIERLRLVVGEKAESWKIFDWTLDV